MSKPRPPKWLSVPAVLWAMDEAPGVPPGGLPARLRSTLFAVARYADEDGRGAYPSLAQVAWITGKSESQAGRDVAALAKLGVLLPGDPGLVKEIRADRRPKVHDLPMPRVASGRDASGGSRVAPGRDASSGSRVAPGRNPSGGSRVASGARTGRMGLQTGSHLDANEQDLKRSGTTRGRVGATAPRTSAPRAQDQTPRHAPPCPDCGTPYTAGQLADDDFYRRAMGGDAGCIHADAEAPGDGEYPF